MPSFPFICRPACTHTAWPQGLTLVGVYPSYHKTYTTKLSAGRKNRTGVKGASAWPEDQKFFVPIFWFLRPARTHNAWPHVRVLIASRPTSFACCSNLPFDALLFLWVNPNREFTFRVKGLTRTFIRHFLGRFAPTAHGRKGRLRRLRPRAHRLSRRPRTPRTHGPNAATSGRRRRHATTTYHGSA